MGTIKEVFQDHTIDGEGILGGGHLSAPCFFALISFSELPPNVVLVGALKKVDPSGPPIFSVPPPSLNDIIVNLGTLSGDQEAAFIASLINMRYINLSLLNKFLASLYCFRYDRPRKVDDELQLQEDERTTLLDFILFAHKFMKEAAMDHISVSLRDIMF